MSLTDLLGAMMQSGMAPSSRKRAKNVLGAESGDLMESLSGLVGGKGGDLGGILGEVLNSAGRAAGGKQNLAVGGLGALAGALLGGGTRSMGGALGGGAMALIGAIAFKALQGAGQKTDNVPLGLLQPRNQAEQQKLEQQTELVLKAMINAAKSDGRIDKDEYRLITGKLKEAGVSQEDMYYIIEELQKPMNTDWIIRAGKASPELAAQIFAATLMTIEVDTQAEKSYLRELSSGMGLSRDVVNNIEHMVGMQAV